MLRFEILSCHFETLRRHFAILCHHFTILFHRVELYAVTSNPAKLNGAISDKTT